jgi:hypothetical protein
MFRRSSPSSHPTLFSSTHSFLSARSQKVYENPQEWHNLFHREVIERIDEDAFRPLFSDGQGAPNASIRILIGMMILKEAQGWSDMQLFEHCQFNLLVRRSLGLLNMDDPLPVPSTYYLLRKHMVRWENEGNGNLFEQVFASVTKSQSTDFQVSGKSIRMDSKLMGSNIAWYSRYELIHETLRIAYRSLKGHVNSLSLSASELSLLDAVSGESGDQVSYRSSKSEIESKLSELGMVIYKIIRQTEAYQTEAICTLRRVFHEQYLQSDDVVHPRSKAEISAKSVQSPYDTECHYRQKDDQKIKGYSYNVAETCDTGNKLNLITHVLVDTASAADCDFLQPAIEATQEVVTEKVATTNADGAYHSAENQDYCKENNIDLVLGAIQGKPSRYDLSTDENGELVVTDLQTNTVVPSHKVKSHKKETEPKWAIHNDKNKKRYFTQKQIDTCSLRKQIADRTPEELNVRNNVEATIFQLAYHYSNAKSRYRGLIKQKMWANARCLWVNFVRINNFIASGGSNCDLIEKNNATLSYFYTQIENIWMNMQFFFRFLINHLKTINVIYDTGNFCPRFPKNNFW